MCAAWRRDEFCWRKYSNVESLSLTRSLRVFISLLITRETHKTTLHRRLDLQFAMSTATSGGSCRLSAVAKFMRARRKCRRDAVHADSYDRVVCQGVVTLLVNPVSILRLVLCLEYD